MPNLIKIYQILWPGEPKNHDENRSLGLLKNENNGFNCHGYNNYNIHLSMLNWTRNAKFYQNRSNTLARRAKNP